MRLSKSVTPINFSLYNAEINDLEINNRAKTEYNIKTCEPIQLGLFSSLPYPVQAVLELPLSTSYALVQNWVFKNKGYCIHKKQSSNELLQYAGDP
jgi:hypothetical protein